MTVCLHRGCEANAQRTPLEGLVLGWLAVLLLVLCVAGIKIAPERIAQKIRRFAFVWSASLLCFFGGVHRGSSFYAKNGPTHTAIGSLLVLYFMGLVSLLMPRERGAWRLLQFGHFFSLATDLELARTGQLPRFLLRLRPAQMVVLLATLFLLPPEK